LPLDYTAVKKAVIATGKVLLLHEDTLTGGIGGEIAAWIAENCFEHLDAPSYALCFTRYTRSLQPRPGEKFYGIQQA
jgi:pyruvate/2-oxoglutarate/acetoin dehydrogenase E1 component